MTPTSQVVLKNVIAVLFLLLIATGVAYIFFSQSQPGRIEINYDLGISGKITGVNRARGYKIYVNASKDPYSLDRFSNITVDGNNSLGYYVEPNDVIDKKPNSDTLWLNRGMKKTYWLYEKKD